MEIYNKYNVGQTYYRLNCGNITSLRIVKLVYRLHENGSEGYNYTYNEQGSVREGVAESDLKLFETKDECRKYAIAKLLEQ